MRNDEKTQKLQTGDFQLMAYVGKICIFGLSFLLLFALDLTYHKQTEIVSQSFHCIQTMNSKAKRLCFHLLYSLKKGSNL